MAFLGSIREKREKHREEKRLLLVNDIYNSGNGTVIRQTNSYAEFLFKNGIALAPGKAGTRHCAYVGYKNLKLLKKGRLKAVPPMGISHGFSPKIYDKTENYNYHR